MSPYNLRLLTSDPKHGLEPQTSIKPSQATGREIYLPPHKYRSVLLHGVTLQTPPCLVHSPIPIDCSICHTEFCSPWLLVNLHSETLLWNAKDCRTVKEGWHDVQYVKQKDIFSLSLPCCQCTAEAQGHHPPPVANPCISFQFQLAEIMVLFYYLFYFIVKLLQRW